ncbi:GM15344 [Drosophila sechellia]|uniref:GM15344 n=1 Tax=Drosophila sechellia TaxID=7238 RepID=B4IBD4_DROSE|nr:GM15344 [Drosophila sechellia]
MEFVGSVGGRCGCGCGCGAGRSDGERSGSGGAFMFTPGHDAAAISIRLATFPTDVHTGHHDHSWAVFLLRQLHGYGRIWMGLGGLLPEIATLD